MSLLWRQTAVPLTRFSVWRATRTHSLIWRVVCQFNGLFKRNTVLKFSHQHITIGDHDRRWLHIYICILCVLRALSQSIVIFSSCHCLCLSFVRSILISRTRRGCNRAHQYPVFKCLGVTDRCNRRVRLACNIYFLLKPRLVRSGHHMKLRIYITYTVLGLRNAHGTYILCSNGRRPSWMPRDPRNTESC